MKRRAFLLLMAICLSGCATINERMKEMPWAGVDLTDGVNRHEAALIAQKYIVTTQFAEDVATQTAKAVENENTACLTDHWMVVFADKNPFWKQRYYYVIVGKNTGRILTAGINWYQGNHWLAVTRGIDACQ